MESVFSLIIGENSSTYTQCVLHAEIIYWDREKMALHDDNVTGGKRLLAFAIDMSVR